MSKLGWFLGGAVAGIAGIAAAAYFFDDCSGGYSSYGEGELESSQDENINVGEVEENSGTKESFTSIFAESSEVTTPV